MRVELPENISSYQAGNVGGFTWRQLLFCGGGIGMFIALSAVSVWKISSLPLRIAVMAVAFLLAGGMVWIGFADLYGLSVGRFLSRQLQQISGKDNRPATKTGAAAPDEPVFTPAKRRLPLFRRHTEPKPLRYIPGNARDTLPIQQLYENGLLLLTPKTDAAEKRYALIFSVSNANYALLRESAKESKAAQYADIFSALPPDIHMQELYVTRPVQVEQLQRTLLPDATSATVSPELKAAYTAVQSRYIDQVADAISDCDLYGVLSYAVQNELEDPYSILYSCYQDVHAGLTSIGSSSELLTAEAVLRLLHQCIYPLEETPFMLPDALYVKGLRLKDILIHDDIRFTYTGTQIGSTLCRNYYIQSYKKKLDDGLLTALLSSRHRIILSKHIDHIDSSEAQAAVQKRLETLEGEKQTRKIKNKETGGDYVPYRLQQEIKACEETLNELGDSQQMFSLGLYITVYAKDERELAALDKFVTTTAARHFTIATPVFLRQEEAFGSMLPLGCDRLEYSVQHISRALSVLHAFTYKQKFAPQGYFYGINTVSKTPIIHARKTDINGHAYFLGQTGSGKSLLVKLEALDTLMLSATDQIFYIDPQNEMNAFCGMVGGQVIDVAPHSGTAINPFDIYAADAEQESAIRGKVSLIFALMEVWKGEKLSAKERSILDRCVMQVYKPVMGKTLTVDNVPTMPDFAEELKKQPEQEAADLLLYLEMYVFGSVDMFSRRTNIALENRFQNFQLGGLGDHLKTSGMLFLLDFIKQRTALNFSRGHWSWLYADEFQRYYRSPAAGAFFEEVFSGYRKLGGLATGLTQNITDLAAYPNGKAMLANSNMIVLLNNSQQNVELAAELYDLSPDQQKFLRVAKPGHGLFVNGEDVIPFEHEYPADNPIFSAISTDFKDKQRAMGLI